jgi:hypothetical protein
MVAEHVSLTPITYDDSGLWIPEPQDGIGERIQMCWLYQERQSFDLVSPAVLRAVMKNETTCKRFSVYVKCFRCMLYVLRQCGNCS